jgi:hypothetical protein
MLRDKRKDCKKRIRDRKNSVSHKNTNFSVNKFILKRRS